MLKVLLRSLADVRVQLDRAVETMPRPLIVCQEGDETSGGDIALRQPFRYLLEHGAPVSILVVRDDPAGGMWRDPVGDLADRTFSSRRDAHAATAGYILFPKTGRPGFLRRDIWDRQLDTEALITRLELGIDPPPRVKEPPAGKKRKPQTAPIGSDEYEATQTEPKRHRPGPRKPAPPPGHRTRTLPDFEPPDVEEPTPRPPAPEADPFAVLGLRTGASEDDVVKAFRALIVQYHPDKVAHLAPEFRSLADHRTRELTDAYDKARKRARGE